MLEKIYHSLLKIFSQKKELKEVKKERTEAEQELVELLSKVKAGKVHFVKITIKSDQQVFENTCTVCDTEFESEDINFVCSSCAKELQKQKYSKN